MAAIRSITEIARKWATVTPGRAAQYEEGVKSPKKDYVTGAVAANDAWKAGVTAAVSGNRFESGVRRAGTEKWKKGAVEKGVARYGPGVSVAEPDYAAGFSPYADAIKAATLPPRGPRRSPQNLQRVNAIVTALSAKKEAMLKGGR